jgi:hypothetical protein
MPATNGVGWGFDPGGVGEEAPGRSPNADYAASGRVDRFSTVIHESKHHASGAAVGEDAVSGCIRNYSAQKAYGSPEFRLQTSFQCVIRDEPDTETGMIPDTESGMKADSESGT